MSAALWQRIKVGELDLDHRLAMARMRRSRSTPEGIPTQMNAEYYAQRASIYGGGAKGYADYPVLTLEVRQ